MQIKYKIVLVALLLVGIGYGELATAPTCKANTIKEISAKRKDPEPKAPKIDAGSLAKEWREFQQLRLCDAVPSMVRSPRATTVKVTQKVFEWWHKAAEQGHVKAQFRVGWCYANGFGVPRNRPEAIKWLRRAANQPLDCIGKRLGMRMLKELGQPVN